MSLIVFVFPGSLAFAACPSADLTGDCFVDYEDFALMGGQWLNGYDSNDLTEMAIQWLSGDPNIYDDMAYIPDGEFEMGDHLGEGQPRELPVHLVYVDSFYMSRYTVTNQQYCDYLNSAKSAKEIKVHRNIIYAFSDNSNSYPYCDTHSADTDSQIDYSAGLFSVRLKDGIIDMSDHPMLEVSWYGAVAYCNWRSQQEGYDRCYNLSDPNWQCDFTKNGYRLPTEAEWEYAARGDEHNPYYRYPWGDSIDGSKANYWDSGDPYETGASPWTTPVGYYDGGQIPAGTDMANGYGLYDMVGNVWEYCNDWSSETYYSISPYDNPTGPVSGTRRIVRGVDWVYGKHGPSYLCRVAARVSVPPDSQNAVVGFRIVLDF